MFKDPPCLLEILFIYSFSKYAVVTKAIPGWILYKGKLFCFCFSLGVLHLLLWLLGGDEGQSYKTQDCDSPIRQQKHFG